MPRKTKVPRYSLHKASGQARVIMRGKHVYLGAFGSPESKEAYARLIAESLSSPVLSTPDPGGNQYPEISVNELLLRYLEFAARFYSDPQTGKPTDEVGNLKAAMRPVRTLYGLTPARNFGPKALKACITYMESQGTLSRQGINARMARIKRIFRWAASEELVSPSVFEGLRTVAGLRFGRTTAIEREPVKPVANETIDMTLPFLAPPLADMVLLQRLTGMRPQDVTQMRLCDIEITGEIWIYRPPNHKTRYRGQGRFIPLGVRAQNVLKTYLTRPVGMYLFSPAQADTWRREQRRLSATGSKQTNAGESRRSPQPDERKRRKRPHWSKFFDPTAGVWLEGGSAVQLLLNWRASAVDKIPIAAEVSPTVTTIPPIAPEDFDGESRRAIDLLNKLAPDRADNYHDWIRVGMILYNLNPSDEMRDAWDDWSRQSPKYKRGECAAKWKTFGGRATGDAVGIGSLVRMAHW